MRVISSSRLQSGWRLALVAWLCLACVLCSPPLPASAAERTILPSELTPWIENLRKADAILTECEEKLTISEEHSRELEGTLRQTEGQLSTLRAALQLWRERSDAQEISLAESWERLETLESSLGKLAQRYEALSLASSRYRAASEKQIASLDRSMKAWRTAAIAGGIGALAVGFLVGVLAGR